MTTLICTKHHQPAQAPDLLPQFSEYQFGKRKGQVRILNTMEEVFTESSPRWRWHQAHLSLFSLLSDVRDGIEYYSVPDLSKPKATPLTDAQMEALLRAEASKLAPCESVIVDNRGSRTHEQNLRGYAQWGAGRYENGNIWVALSHWCCYNTKRLG